ncbi:MAG TPA: hypothetical protein VNT20_05380 [Flavisolibacter sp.]|nr:hypothetical protein [Flavisolibacter sp.]
MNYNILAYVVFLSLIIFIIVYVGRYFYSNGRIFIIALFNGHVALADQVNKLLLIAYYLFNIGYAFLKLKQWERITNWEMMFSSLATKIGILIFILALTHYFNMLVIYLLSKSKSISITHKSFQS